MVNPRAQDRALRRRVAESARAKKLAVTHLMPGSEPRALEHAARRHFAGPLVVGSVYNAQNMPPLELPASVLTTGFKSGSLGGDPLNAF